MTPQRILAIWAGGAALLALLSSALGAAVALPPPGWRNLPWPVQARLVYPARVAPWLCAFGICAMLTPVCALYLGSMGLFAIPTTWIVAADTGAIFATILVAVASAWFVSPRRTPLTRWLAGSVTRLLVGFPNLLIMT